MRLTREVRLFLGGEAHPGGGARNTWAGWPAGGRTLPHTTIRCSVEGDVERATGYLCDIRKIDEAVRGAVMAYFDGAKLADAPGSAVAVIEIWREVRRRLDGSARVVAMELAICPYLRFEARMNEPSEVLMTESFEFSASHRLYCADLSDEENARVFGKCSNPNGHGHNYVVDVTIKGQPDSNTGLLMSTGRFEGIVKTLVIDRFDHKHLNVDCEEFRQLNPSIENIARTIWRLLEGKVQPCVLHRVRAWETAKTFAECVSGD